MYSSFVLCCSLLPLSHRKWQFFWPISGPQYFQLHLLGVRVLCLAPKQMGIKKWDSTGQCFGDLFWLLNTNGTHHQSKRTAKKCVLCWDEQNWTGLNITVIKDQGVDILVANYSVNINLIVNELTKRIKVMWSCEVPENSKLYCLEGDMSRKCAVVLTCLVDNEAGFMIMITFSCKNIYWISQCLVSRKSVVWIFNMPDVVVWNLYWNPGFYHNILAALLFPDCLSGSGHREQEGTTRTQWVRTQRVHDVIRGNGTAVSHCVIVYSVASLRPIFWSCREGARPQACFLFCLWTFFHTHVHTVYILRHRQAVIHDCLQNTGTLCLHAHTTLTHTVLPLSLVDSQTMKLWRSSLLSISLQQLKFVCFFSLWIYPANT